MPVTLTRSLHANLLEEARDHHPRECCGLLLGEGDRIDSLVPAPNVAATPETHFEIDPVVLLAAHRRARESAAAQIVGYYHSHPNGLAEPSGTDRQHSTGDLRIWAIIADGQVAFFRDSGNGFSKLDGYVADDACTDS
ncbi:M67 family metallopeptidase [Novosphingobium sp. 9]|uniref:M67 family metallopeptidase n=1 Tax=Novosphingobium sp. 9 TaxID=2025349 RepID=UPI0021B6357F|nr:M67 family metallopeptidase [Novosphingobium sp. 9]